MPSMKLDTATIVFISIITDVILVLILLHTWRTRTTYPGFIIWIAGTACWAIGSLLSMLLPTMQPQFIPKIIGNGLIMLHPALLLEGINQFHSIRRRWWGTPLNMVLVLAGVFNVFYFLYVSENLFFRSIAINLVLAILFARIVVVPLFHADVRRYSMQWILSTCLLPLAALLFTRAWTLHSGSSYSTFSDMMSQETLLRLIIFYGIIAELVIAYSYLSLTSDRVEEELLAERQKLMKTIHVSDRYQSQLQDLHNQARGQAEVQERFLDMVSHEYRTPLAIIQANIDIMELKEQRAGGAVSGSLNNMQHAVDRLVDIFEATRRRKDFELVTLEPVFEIIEVEHYIKKTLSAATAFWGDRFVYQNNLSFECRLYADYRQLRTVLLNLLDNAAKYSSLDVPVTMKIDVSGEQLEIIVSNHPFLPLLDDTEVLFQKFKRGSNSSDTGGTGQGLYLARSIVEQHSGSLDLKVDEGGNVVATIKLPMAKEPKDTHE